MVAGEIIGLLEIITGLSAKDLMSIIITIIFAVVIIRIIIYKEINRINKELENIDKKGSWEYKRLDEKLKIYERLSIIEAKLNLKNGSKK